MVEEQETAVVPATGAAVVPAYPPVQPDPFDDALTIPYLGLTQKTTEYEDMDPKEYSFGDIVAQRRVVLPEPLHFYAVKMTPFFEEYVPHGSDDIPKRATTEAEMRHILGPEGLSKTERWGPYYPVAIITLLVEKPEGLEGGDDLFPFDVDGKNFGFFEFSAKRSSFKMWTDINSTKRLAWKGNMQKGGFLLSTKRKSGANAYCVPVTKINNGDETPEAILDLMKIVTG